MRRFACSLLFCLAALAAFADVQTVGDVSFAVPNGWTYTARADFGAMMTKSDAGFWLIAVYTPMPSSGNPNVDYKAAWQRTVLTMPGYKPLGYDPYKMSQTAGYPGTYSDAPNTGNTTYTRLFLLQAGKTCVPVVFTSNSRGVLDAMDHMATAVVGSVRVAPLRASPFKESITVADLAGSWTNGIVTSINYYNNSGQYQTNSLTAMKAGYNIAGNGSYTYKADGLLNNRSTSDADTGVVELGGAFVTFKGQKRVTQYRFINIQQALDGSSVLALFPPVDMSQINAVRDITYWTRPAK
jgi:hypothetical protein